MTLPKLTRCFCGWGTGSSLDGEGVGDGAGDGRGAAVILKVEEGQEMV